MAEIIQALSQIAFPRPRLQKRERETDADFKFAHWLADEANANDSLPAESAPVPLMSPQGILILAQAEEEEFAYAAHAYEQTAEKLPKREDQYAFEFMLLEHAVSEDI